MNAYGVGGVLHKATIDPVCCLSLLQASVKGPSGSS